MSDVTPLVALRPDGSLAAESAGAPAHGRADDPAGSAVPAVAPGRPRDDDDAYTLPPAARPVVSELRARAGTLVVGAGDAGPRWTVRVEVPEVWDVVRLDASSATPVAAVKRAALGVLLSGTAAVDDYVVKLNGAVVPDERASLAAAGALDGSIFLVTHRRRRAVR
ncbi:hypothetical protein tb265_01650 [Gemmatimonadetes bacterium T265]|nr:hypothetical protein tb265_01650 [Gemmatimonadetes bacterium T265]